MAHTTAPIVVVAYLLKANLAAKCNLHIFSDSKRHKSQI